MPEPDKKSAMFHLKRRSGDPVPGGNPDLGSGEPQPVANLIPISAAVANPAPETQDLPPEVLGDRVVRRMLDEDEIGVATLARLVPPWLKAREDGAREPLWRFLGRQQGIDRESVLHHAASIYGFRPVRISLVGSLALSHHLLTEWPEKALSRVVSMGALPVVADGEAPHASDATRLIIVSDDPSSPDLRRIVDELVDGPYELRYAPAADIEACVNEIVRHVPGAMPEGVQRLARGVAPTTLRRAA